MQSGSVHEETACRKPQKWRKSWWLMSTVHLPSMKDQGQVWETNVSEAASRGNFGQTGQSWPCESSRSYVFWCLPMLRNGLWWGTAILASVTTRPTGIAFSLQLFKLLPLFGRNKFGLSDNDEVTGVSLCSIVTRTLPESRFKVAILNCTKSILLQQFAKKKYLYRAVLVRMIMSLTCTVYQQLLNSVSVLDGCALWTAPGEAWVSSPRIFLLMSWLWIYPGTSCQCLSSREFAS